MGRANILVVVSEVQPPNSLATDVFVTNSLRKRAIEMQRTLGSNQGILVVVIDRAAVGESPERSAGQLNNKLNDRVYKIQVTTFFVISEIQESILSRASCRVQLGLKRR